MAESTPTTSPYVLLPQNVSTMMPALGVRAVFVSEMRMLAPNVPTSTAVPDGATAAPVNGWGVKPPYGALVSVMRH